jgi:hypothetical protein
MLFAVVGWSACATVLVLSQIGPRRATPQLRPALRWIFTGGLLICTGILISAIALDYGWTQIHRLTGGVDLLLMLAGLACQGVGAVAMRRSSRISHHDPSSARS